MLARDGADELGLKFEDALWLSFVGLSDRACHDMLRAATWTRHNCRRCCTGCRTRYDAHVEAGLPLKPGVLELLELLAQRGVPRAVVTSTRRDRAHCRSWSCAACLPHFDDGRRPASDVVHSKPAPDIYLLAAERLDVAPAHCVVLEDSVPGVRAALAAGMTPIQVPDLVMPGRGGARAGASHRRLAGAGAGVDRAGAGKPLRQHHRASRNT